MWDANHNAADYGENLGRGSCSFFDLISFSKVVATACEVLARRVVHLLPPDRQSTVMSTRFKHRQIDGDESETSSALEMAIDSHWYSTPCRHESHFHNAVLYSCHRARHKTVSD